MAVAVTALLSAVAPSSEAQTGTGFCANCWVTTVTPDLSHLVGIDYEGALHVGTVEAGDALVTVPLPAGFGVSQLEASSGAQEVLVLGSRHNSPMLVRPFEGTSETLDSSWTSCPGDSDGGDLLPFGPRTLSDDGWVLVEHRCFRDLSGMTATNVRTGEERLAESIGGNSGWATISPDGNSAVGLPGQRSPGGVRIDLDTGDETRWGPSTGPEVISDYLPDDDASHVAYIRRPSVGARAGIYVEAVEGGRTELRVDLTGQAISAVDLRDVGPDGGLIAYTVEVPSVHPDGKPEVLPYVATAEFGESALTTSIPTTHRQSLRCDHRCGLVANAFGADVQIVAIGGPFVPPTRLQEETGDTAAFATPITADDATTLSNAVARQFSGDAVVVHIARNDDFADALASGPLQTEGPLLLLRSGGHVDADSLEAIAEITPARFVILGGDEAVSHLIEAELADIAPVSRIGGTDRIATALGVAESVAADGTVLVVRAYGDEQDPSRGWADATAAGGLAARLGAPLLLTPSDALDPRVADYLRQASYDRVLVVGGNMALSDAVEDQIRDIVPVVERVAGPTREATAVALADVDNRETTTGAILVPGGTPFGWAGGFVMAGASAGMRAPVLLTGEGELSATTRAFLDERISLTPQDESIVITCVVAAAVCEEARGAAGLTPFVNIKMPRPGLTLQHGDALIVEAQPLPNGSLLSVSGTCLTQPEESTTSQVIVQVAVDGAGAVCHLLARVLHADGSHQRRTATYGLPSDSSLIAPSDVCPRSMGDISADGATVLYLARFGCPDNDGATNLAAVFVDVPSGERRSIALEGMEPREMQISPSGDYGSIRLEDQQTLILERTSGQAWGITDSTGLSGFVENISADDQILVAMTSNDEAVLLDLPSREVAATVNLPTDDDSIYTPWLVTADGTRLIGGVGSVEIGTGEFLPRGGEERYIASMSSNGDTMAFYTGDPPEERFWLDSPVTGQVEYPSITWPVSGDGRYAVIEGQLTNLESGQSGPRAISMSHDASAVLVAADGGLRVISGPR